MNRKQRRLEDKWSRREETLTRHLIEPIYFTRGGWSNDKSQDLVFASHFTKRHK